MHGSCHDTSRMDLAEWNGLAPCIGRISDTTISAQSTSTIYVDRLNSIIHTLCTSITSKMRPLGFPAIGIIDSSYSVSHADPAATVVAQTVYRRPRVGWTSKLEKEISIARDSRLQLLRHPNCREIDRPLVDMRVNCMISFRI